MRRHKINEARDGRSGARYHSARTNAGPSPSPGASPVGRSDFNPESPSKSNIKDPRDAGVSDHMKLFNQFVTAMRIVYKQDMGDQLESTLSNILESIRRFRQASFILADPKNAKSLYGGNINFDRYKQEAETARVEIQAAHKSNKPILSKLITKAVRSLYLAASPSDRNNIKTAKSFNDISEADLDSLNIDEATLVYEIYFAGGKPSASEIEDKVSRIFESFITLKEQQFKSEGNSTGQSFDPYEFLTTFAKSAKTSQDFTARVRKQKSDPMAAPEAARSKLSKDVQQLAKELKKALSKNNYEAAKAILSDNGRESLISIVDDIELDQASERDLIISLYNECLSLLDASALYLVESHIS